MSEQTVAASSPAEVEDVFRGEQPTFDEYSTYRQTGELPARFKPAEAEEVANPDAPEETVEPEGDEPETDPDSEPEEVQEQPKQVSPAEKRIKQLLAKVKELERNQQPAAKQDVNPVPSTVQQPAARTKPTAEDKGQDGKPKYGTYEDFIEDLADWKSEQQVARYRREQVEQQAVAALKVKMDEARSRYDDADDVIFPAAKAINAAQIPAAVKQVVAESAVFTDLLYVLNSDEGTLKAFISEAQRDPRAALAKVFEYERGIRKELAKTGKNAEETEVTKAPENRQTKAPKPPSPVNGGSSRAFDVSDESLSAEEWARKRAAQIARRKG